MIISSPRTPGKEDLMPLYRWIALALLALAVLWLPSGFIRFALWKKFFRESWEGQPEETKEWWRSLKLGPIGLLEITGVALVGALVFVWLLANAIRTGDLRMRQSVRWLLMPVALPIDLVGTVIYWASLWVAFRLDDAGLTHPYRLPRPTT